MKNILRIGTALASAALLAGCAHSGQSAHSRAKVIEQSVPCSTSVYYTLTVKGTSSPMTQCGGGSTLLVTVNGNGSRGAGLSDPDIDLDVAHLRLGDVIGAQADGAPPRDYVVTKVTSARDELWRRAPMWGMGWVWLEQGEVGVVAVPTGEGSTS